MAVGRKPKPAGAKVLEGTFRNDRHNARAPVPEAGAPEPPGPLNDAERAVWARVLEVSPSGVISKADGYLLDLFARCYVEFLELDAAIKVEGRVIVRRDQHGAVLGAFPNPKYKLRAALVPELRKLGEQLGLTPAGRARLVSGDGDGAGADPFAALMGGGGITGKR